MTTVVDRLPAHPASAGRARRFVRETLESWELDDVSDVASLLVSELVTNALIHAGTDMVLSVVADEGCVRVRVADGSPTAPNVRHYDADAATGRGLGLVEALSSAWGVESGDAGKAVWFALATDAATAARVGGAADTYAAAGAGAADAADAAGAVEREVVLAQAPLRLVWASVQYGDALLREAALMALAGEPMAGAEARWTAPAIDLTPLLEQVRAGLDRGDTVADVVLRLPGDRGEAALRRLALVDEADRLAEEGELLSPASLPELAACRRWHLGEVARQLEGARPTPWALPAEADTRTAAVLEAAQLDALRRLPPGIVAADDTNHILYVDDEAASLLGWTVDDLTGRRLTTLVPPELREAHLAGYTRYQVTRETHLIGTAVTVPALRRDGTTVEVVLELSVLAVTGRRCLVAHLQATGAG